MNSKGRRFLLYLLFAVMLVTQVAFTKTEESNTSDESVVINTNNTDETDYELQADSENVVAEDTTLFQEDAAQDMAASAAGEATAVASVVIVEEQNEAVPTEKLLGETEETESSEYQDMIVSYADPYLPVRTDASRDSSTVGKMYPGSYAEIVERGNEWTKIKSGNVEGYIQNIYVCFDDEAEALANQLKGDLEKAITLKEEEEIKKKEAAAKAAAAATTANLSSYDVCLLAAIVDWESNAESYEGKLGVAYVVLNRVNSPRYANTIEGVLSASGQFGGVTDGNGNFSARFEERINKYVNGTNNDCLRAAQDAIAGRNNPLDATYLYFNTVVGSCSEWQTIGNHTFYNY